MGNGKAYANRKKSSERHDNDFYETPYSLTWELLKLNIVNKDSKILDPCCGKYAISKWFKNEGFDIIEKDLSYGNDFFKDDYKDKEFDFVIMNPPFDLWDNFVTKAKKISNKVISIGKTDYFSCYQRLENGIWNNLKDIYIFNRKVDYQSPTLDSGEFCVGSLTSGWFVWDCDYNDKPRINFIDIQKYAKLGSYDSFIEKNPNYDIIREYIDIFEL